MSRPSSVANPYQKRLGLLALGMLLVLSGLVSRHAWLSVVQGEANRAAAMTALTRRALLPMVRGDILDRRGEILARDAAPGYSVELRFDLIALDDWVTVEATRMMRATMSRSAWRGLGDVGRRAAIDRARGEVAARRRSMIRAIARHGAADHEGLLARVDEIRRSTERLAQHVQDRQYLVWAAAALGTDLASLEGLAVDWPDELEFPPGAPIAGDLRFNRGAVRALEIDPARLGPMTFGTWGLDELLTARDVSPEAFARRPVREQRAFHQVLAPVDFDAMVAIRIAAESFGLDDVVRVRESVVRVRPWADDDLLVEVDGSMLPGPIRFDEPRTIPVRGVGRRLIGRMTRTYGEDVQRRPFDAETDRGGYAEQEDRVGRTGLEASEERRLRGARGLTESHVRLAMDTRRPADDGEGGGAPIGPSTNTVQRIAPRDGEDVRATIDIRLQARIRAILHPEVGLTAASAELHGTSGLGGVEAAAGHPLAVGVAVLDVATGEVLAVVNGPIWDELPDPEFEPLVVESGWLDLDIAGRFGTTPGSTIKPLILTAAVSDGLRRSADQVTCTGHYWDNPADGGRCWIYRAPVFATHGSLDGPKALARSCNIFFHTVADQFAGREQRLLDWLDAFGLGRRPGGVPQFGPGTIPTMDQLTAADGRAQRAMIGTGQASMTWTPVQAAAAYASFFRAGHLPEVHLVDGGATEPDAVDGDRPHFMQTAEALVATTEGLEYGVSRDWGTACRITVGGVRHRIFTPDAQWEQGLVGRPYEGVMIWGKTGTAQQQAWLQLPAAPDENPLANPDEDLAADPESEDEALPSTTRQRRTLSHGWFAGVVASDDLTGPPGEYAIAVVVRWGGSGGYTAGPIANQVILALMQEGYLPMEPGLRRTSIIRGEAGDGPTAPPSDRQVASRITGDIR